MEEWENNKTYMDACCREADTYYRWCSICHRRWGYFSDILKSDNEINIEEQESGSLCPPCIAFKKLSERVLELEKQKKVIKEILININIIIICYNLLVVYF